MTSRIVTRTPQEKIGEMHGFPRCFGYYEPRNRNCVRCLRNRHNSNIKALLAETKRFVLKHKDKLALTAEIFGCNLDSRKGVSEFVRKYIICSCRHKLLQELERVAGDEQ